MSHKIELTQGKVAIVDNIDFKRLNVFNWYALKHGKTFYAARAVRRDGTHTVYMHRMILDAPDDMDIDHIDGNGLNNTRINLRLATRSHNQANRGKNKNNTSGFKGVHWDAFAGAWKALIMVNKRLYHIGYFQTSEDAAHAYDEAALEYFGEFAHTNF